MLMSLNNVGKRFGALQVLKDVSFDIRPGEIFGIAGPNGAGKSTLLNACTGLIRPDSGQVHFAGQRTDRLPPHRLCHLGIARTYQIAQVFDSLSVRENIETGAMFGAARLKSERRATLKALFALIGLEHCLDERASDATLLQRKMIMLGAALATQPTLLLKLRQELGVSFVIVEHKMRALARLSNRLLILNFGQVMCVDTPQQVLNDPQVIDIYLGATGHAQG